MDDRQIVNQVLSGNTESFSLLVDRYYRKILGFICKTGIPRDDAEDLAQEVFIRAFRNLFRYDASWSFSTWIFRIAVNLSKNYLLAINSNSQRKTHEGIRKRPIKPKKVKRYLRQWAGPARVLP